MHFRECVYRAPAKPLEVSAPGDEEQEEEEEADAAKALSTPLHCHPQTKARTQCRCYAGPCEMQEGLKLSLLAVFSQTSSMHEVHQKRERKTPGKYVALLHI